MTRAVVQQLEALLNRSFDGENTQSLLGNLTDVQPDDWDWIPPGGERTVRDTLEHPAIARHITIRDIFEHAAIAKHIYTDFLFGDARRSWEEVAAECAARAGRDAAALVVWARDGHAAFMRGMSSLQDDDLATMTTKWHGARDTRAEVIAVMIQHDCYHAGEINALRSVHHHWTNE